MAARLSELVPAGLLKRASKGVPLVERSSHVRLFCHYDPDGATSAAVLAQALQRKGKSFHATMSTQIGEEDVARLNEEDNDLTIVADMGSGQLDRVEALEGPVIVLDHHRPPRDSQAVVHVNPHLFGVNGTHGACGATTSLLFSLILDERNWDLTGVAVAGAIGDRQHVGGFDGLNAPLVREAVARGVIEGERQVALRDLPLADALANSISPFFVGLSGDRDGAERFLRRIKVDPSARIKGLTAEERRRLVSHLAAKLLEQGAMPDSVETVVDDRYWIPGLGIYADELSAYVNACSRLDAQGLAMSLCFGDREAFSRAEEIRVTYTETVLGYLRDLVEKAPFEKEHIQFFYCKEQTLAGSVAGTGMQYFLPQSRPVVGLSVMDGKTKVSSRGTKYLVANGLDLAAAMREAAESVGGNGGGHDVASGATVPKGKEEAFLTLVDGIVGRQIAPAKRVDDAGSDQ